MKLPHLIYYVTFVILSAFPADDVVAQAAPDTVRLPHRLREVEIRGLKNDAGSGVAELVTRVSGAEARRLGISEMKSLGGIAPNFYMPDYGSRMTSSIYVRGLGSRMDQPVVGLTVDNIPYLNKDTYDFEIADIESIEVLRGAQSVLNGRNTMGGQINVLTVSPMRWQGMRAMLEYSRASTVKASASVYGKISKPLAMSLSGFFGRTDGFWRNTFTGKRVGQDTHGSLRWKTEWRPSARFSIANTASLGLDSQEGYPYENVATGLIAYDDTCSYRRTHFADGLTVAWAGKRVVVTSVMAVQYLDDRMTLDQDFLPDDYFTLTQSRREWSVSEDLFTRGARGAYGWLGGVFAFSKLTGMDAPVNFKDTGIRNLIEDHRNAINSTYPISWDSRDFTLGSSFDNDSYGVALYHESSWHTGAWNFSAGLRCEVEHVSLSYESRCSTGFSTYHIQPDGPAELYSHTDVDIYDRDGLSQTFVELLPRLAVEYSAGSFRPYFSFSKAYKAGGYNTQMFSDVLSQRIMSIMGLSSLYTLDEIVSYQPEKSFNYEAGVHAAFPDKGLSADLALFFIDCRNQQLTVFPPGTVTGRIMTNAGRTRSIGAELTASWRPTEDLSLRMSYGYTSATFRRYDNGRGDFRGKRVPYAPENTLSVSADWRLPSLSFLGVTPSVCLSARGAGEICWNEENTLRQPFYCLPSASVTLASGSRSLKMWVTNFTGTRYDTFYFMSMGNSFVQRGRPVEFGVTLRASFSR